MSEMTVSLTRRGFCAAAAGLVVFPLEVRATYINPEQIMQASYQATRFKNVRFTAGLSLRSSKGTKQNRSLSGVAKIVDGGALARLMRFTTPADMSGVATLTFERGSRRDDLWIYLPAMRRVRKLVTANRADPWVGSDFSYGDILGHKVSDWTHKLSGTERLSGGDCWCIDSVPLTPGLMRETGYGRRRSWIRKSDYSLLHCDFFSVSGQPLKSATFSDFRVLDGSNGKVQPMVMTMKSTRSGSTSTLNFKQFDIGAAVMNNEISPEALNK